MSLNKLTKLNLSDNIKSLIKSLFLKQGEIIDYLNRYLTTEDQYQTTIVNISSSQILNMGTTPIELLPAAGVNKYYDIENIILEYIPNTISYNTTSGFVRLYYGNLNAAISSKIVGSDNRYIALITDLKNRSNVSDDTFIPEAVDILYGGEADGILALTSDNGNPTNGNGTMRAIIKYKVRTFGE
jgi:hypothetical protein